MHGCQYDMNSTVFNLGKEPVINMLGGGGGVNRERGGGEGGVGGGGLQVKF